MKETVLSLYRHIERRLINTMERQYKLIRTSDVRRDIRRPMKILLKIIKGYLVAFNWIRNSAFHRSQWQKYQCNQPQIICNSGLLLFFVL